MGAQEVGYEERGVPELWLVDAVACEMLVFRGSADVERYDVVLEIDTAGVLSSPLLPGFELALSELFGDEAQARAVARAAGQSPSVVASGDANSGGQMSM